MQSSLNGCRTYTSKLMMVELSASARVIFDEMRRQCKFMLL